MSEDTKDYTRLPVVAWLCEWMADKRGGVYSGLSKTSLEGLRRSQGEDVLIVSDEPLCRLTDAQARIAEKDARIAQLAAHARGKNKALANALKEIERLKRAIETGLDNELALVGERTELRAQLAQLQAAPAARGVVVLPALKVVEQAWGYDEGGNYAEGFAEGYNDAIDDVQRLNPAPATADSDVREVKP